MTFAPPPYAVITPMKDEIDHLPRLAESLIAQTHRPARWVIVDDGSSDGTREKAGSYAADHEWITVVPSGSDGASRARGAPIVRAFNAGRRELAGDHPPIVVKLDADLYLPPHYFEWVAETFRRDARAGIVGGLVLVPDDERWTPDRTSPYSVHGVAKAYRTECLDAIGGLEESMGWDGIDEYAARARGWQPRVLSELFVLHYDPRGSKQRWWRARWEEGRGAHFMGYLPSFLALRALYRMAVERPPVLGGLVLAAGFAAARLSRRPQVADAEARAELRSEQRGRFRGLLRGRGYSPTAPAAGGGPAFWLSEVPPR